MTLNVFVIGTLTNINGRQTGISTSTSTPKILIQTMYRSTTDVATFLLMINIRPI